jgi:2-oxoisovalerate dehydrogenase E1 component
MLRALDPAGRPLDDRRFDVADVARVHAAMLRARIIDRRLMREARTGRLKGYYPSQGQEALAAIAPLLGSADMVFPQYREQPLRLSMGVTVAEEVDLWAGASPAPWDPHDRRCAPPATSIASHIPHAVGWSWARQHRGLPGIGVAVFGDGATSEGDFHAALTFAGAWQAPVVLVCQNNGIAQTTALVHQTAAPTIAAKGPGYGVASLRVDGMDPFAVAEAFDDAAARARDGGGPTLLELVMERYAGHTAMDRSEAAREAATAASKGLRDPIRRCEAFLAAHGVDVEVAVARIKADADAELAAVLPYGAAVPAGPLAGGSRVGGSAAAESAVRHVAAASTTDAATDRRRLVDGVREGLAAALDGDPWVVLLGQDIVTGGGVWGATAGLADRFRGRVLDTPLSEQGAAGVAVGMALAGLRPIVEIQFGGFSLTAVDQLAGHAARYRWRTGGRWSAPVVVRMPSGAGLSGYEGHNESFDALFVHLPGIDVVAPSTAADAVAVLAAACVSERPTVVLEPTLLYLAEPTVGFGDGGEASSPVRIERIGDAATLVAWGSAVPATRAAAAHLVDAGITCTLVVLRDLMPWDAEPVVAAAAATGRVLIVQDAPRTAGFGAEVAATVAERVPGVRVARAAAPDAPPSPGLLSAATDLSVADVVRAVRDLVDHA